MDQNTTKQLIEAIKTININMNSETGQKAISVIADKLSQYLIFKEVLALVNTTIICITILIAGGIFYWMIKKSKSTKDL